MGGTGVIDRFLETFTRYIDSGFGLLGNEVAFLATTLAAIDVTLAALFWAWGTDEDIIARLVRKTLFVSVFAVASRKTIAAVSHGSRVERQLDRKPCDGCFRNGTCRTHRPKINRP